MNIIEKLLDIPDVEIESTELNEKGDVIITVRSTIGVTRCRKCGRRSSKLHGHDEAIMLRHLPILGRKTYIRICPAHKPSPATASEPRNRRIKPESHKHQQERSITGRSGQQYPGEIAAGGPAMPEGLPGADTRRGGHSRKHAKT